ncbi:MAG: hypothetical protein WBX25_20205 [Rhodomicrobium sp.]
MAARTPDDLPHSDEVAYYLPKSNNRGFQIQGDQLMKRLWAIAITATAAMLIIANSSHAQTGQAINDETKCATATAIMDAPKPDLWKVSELKSYILRTMRVIDHSYGVRDKVEILPRMSEGGVSGVIATATVRCQDHPETTIRDMAIESYEGVRAMQDALGVND